MEAALNDLYLGKKVVLCPLQENARTDVAAVRAMWESTGADCHVMSAVQHDAVFAAVSHLPHLLAFALVAQLVNAEDAALKLDFAGGGFRDFTRIAELLARDVARHLHRQQGGVAARDRHL